MQHSATPPTTQNNNSTNKDETNKHNGRLHPRNNRLNIDKDTCIHTCAHLCSNGDRRHKRTKQHASKLFAATTITASITASVTTFATPLSSLMGGCASAVAGGRGADVILEGIGEGAWPFNFTGLWLQCRKRRFIAACGHWRLRCWLDPRGGLRTH